MIGGESLLLLDVTQTKIRLVNKKSIEVLKDRFLVEGNGFFAIYADGQFDFVCSTKNELLQKLEKENLVLLEVDEIRHCSNCESPMTEGFCFEGDAIQYCSKKCMTEVISWEDYLKLHDHGNGNAYWTMWED